MPYDYSKAMDDSACRLVEGLQWIMQCDYSGVASLG